MFFPKKKEKRLYIPTKAKWYTPPRRTSRPRISRKLLDFDFTTRFTGFFKHSLTMALSLSALTIMLVILFFSRMFAITDIDIARKDFTVDSSAISKELQVFTGKNLILFPRTKAVKLIRDKFPEFAVVDVSKRFPNKLRVELESYEIVANLRAYHLPPPTEVKEEPKKEDPALKDVEGAIKAAFSLTPVETKKETVNVIEQKCLLNEIGQAIFNQEENLELMTITVDGLTEPVQDRQIVIPYEKMKVLTDAVRYFNSTMKIQVKAVRYLPIAREIHFKLDKDLWIWISLEKEYKEQIDRLKTIYEAAELNKEDLAYIDLRVKEKVIYCPRRTSCARNYNPSLKSL